MSASAAMELRSYGSTGLGVSAVAYGAMTIAQDPQLRDGVAPSLLRALERGVTLIDTARVYPKSEELIASTLRAWRGPPPIISTKLHSASRDAYRFYCPIGDAYSPSRIRESVEASLRALGVGVIARCVYDSGGLSGTLSAEDFRARRFLQHAPYEQYQARLDELRQRFVPAEAGSIAELALRFALSVSGVSAVTLGMLDARMVDQAIDAAARGPLTPATVEAIRREHVWTRNFYERLT